ncbi:MAG: hypothetical protein ACXVAY_06855 [Mucilaginibacter sp.]
MGISAAYFTNIQSRPSLVSFTPEAGNNNNVVTGYVKQIATSVQKTVEDQNLTHSKAPNTVNLQQALFADHFNIVQIKEYLGNNEAAITEIIEFTCEELKRYSAALENKINTRDIPGIKRVAHRIYDTAVTVGMPILSKIAIEFDKLNDFEQIHNFETQKINNLLSKTQNEINIVLSAMSA